MSSPFAFIKGDSRNSAAYTLIIKSQIGKQADLVTNTKLLVDNLQNVTKMQGHFTISDIETTHIYPFRNKYKPVIRCTNLYQYITPSSGNTSIAGEKIKFELNETNVSGDLLNQVSLVGEVASTTYDSENKEIAWVDRPGASFVKTHSFVVGDQVIQKIDRREYYIHEQTELLDAELKNWWRLIGQTYAETDYWRLSSPTASMTSSVSTLDVTTTYDDEVGGKLTSDGTTELADGSDILGGTPVAAAKYTASTTTTGNTADSTTFDLNDVNIDTQLKTMYVGKTLQHFKATQDAWKFNVPALFFFCQGVKESTPICAYIATTPNVEYDMEEWKNMLLVKDTANTTSISYLTDTDYNSMSTKPEFKSGSLQLCVRSWIIESWLAKLLSTTETFALYRDYRYTDNTTSITVNDTNINTEQKIMIEPKNARYYIENYTFFTQLKPLTSTWNSITNIPSHFQNYNYKSFTTSRILDFIQGSSISSQKQIGTIARYDDLMTGAYIPRNVMCGYAHPPREVGMHLYAFTNMIGVHQPTSGFNGSTTDAPQLDVWFSNETLSAIRADLRATSGTVDLDPTLTFKTTLAARFLQVFVTIMGGAGNRWL